MHISNINYYPNNTTSSAGTAISKTVNIGTVSLATANSLGISAPSGYTFKGWATSTTGAVAYNDGASVNATESGLSLYAKWYCSGATTCLIDNLCNGGTKTKCSTCGGDGLVNCSDCDGDGTVSTSVKCTNCGGDGTVSSSTRCSSCKGSGSVSSTCSKCGGAGKGSSSTYSQGSYVSRHTAGIDCVGGGSIYTYTCRVCGDSRDICPICQPPEAAFSGHSCSCSSCRGSGSSSSSCGNCGGDGSIDSSSSCGTCNGDGWASSSSNCGNCGGDGKVACTKSSCSSGYIYSNCTHGYSYGNSHYYCDSYSSHKQNSATSSSHTVSCSAHGNSSTSGHYYK